MSLLFDTAAVVSLVERASDSAADLIRSDVDRPYVSFVTISELHVGAESGPASARHVQR